jgi:hypothetical protein
MTITPLPLPTLDGDSPATEKAAQAWNLDQWKKAAEGESGGQGYCEDKFYVRATDSRGHGQRVTFQVPPEIYAEAARMAENKVFPEYQSIADVFRDAVVHHLARRRDQVTDPAHREAIDALHADLELWRVLDGFTRQANGWAKALDQVRGAMATYVRDEAWNQMDVSLFQIALMAEKVDEPYGSRIRAEIKRWRTQMPIEWRE